MRRPPRRPGFTLLEVLLATAIATLLLAALYFAMDMTLRQTQEGRDGVEVDNVARAVFNRMAIDVGASLAPLPPKSGGNAATGTAGGAGATYSSAGVSDTTSAGTTSAGTTSTPSAASPAVGAAGSTGGSGGPQADPGFQAGVVGTDTQLTIFVSRVPRALTDAGALFQPADAAVQTPSDLCRVTYWQGQNGQLCRQERAWVTADGVRGTYEPDLSNEAGDTLADEVTGVQFEYFDGTAWASSWDGTTPGPDGVTPLGPPRAVRVTLTLAVPSSRPGAPPYTQTAIQVIPVRAAPGLNTPPLVLPDLDPGTTSSGSGSSGSGSSSGSTGSTGGASSGGAGSTPTSSGGSSGGASSSGSSMPAAPGGGSAGAKTGGTTGGGGGGSKGGGR